jgi:hypothetical protein
MELYSIDQADARFGIETADYITTKAQQPHELERPYVVLFHLTGPAATRVHASLPKLMENPNAHVLCFKGTMLAGLDKNPEVIEEMRGKYPGRVHFLVPPVPLGEPGPELKKRMSKFQEYLKTAKPPVNWEILDPKIREYLLALWLAMRALDAEGPNSQLEAALRKDPVLRNIIIQAEQEYQMLRADPKASLNLALIDHHRAKPVAAEIWKELQLLKI